VANSNVGDPLAWAEIERVLPPAWRELATQMKLIRKRPPHLGAKVEDIGQVLRLVLFMVATNSALAVATAAFAGANLLTISSVSLHQWMRQLGPYLAELLKQMIGAEHAKFSPDRWAGFVPTIVDASVVNNPGAKGTTVRVHKALRLSDLRVVDVVVTDDKTGETFRHFQPQEGELYLGDRVYANPPGIAWLKAHGAEAMVRFNRGALPLYDAHGAPIDVFTKLAKLTKPDRPREWDVFVHAEDQRIQGRLIAVRLPEDKADQARVRARKEQGPSVTEETLRMASFVVLFTTVSKDRLGMHLVLQLYALRWQVELEFKRDKSITGLDRLPNFRPDTIESWVYAKLLLHQIARKLAACVGDVPPCVIAEAAIGASPKAA
jgi:hypothetical protein